MTIDAHVLYSCFHYVYRSPIDLRGSTTSYTLFRVEKNSVAPRARCTSPYCMSSRLRRFGHLNAIALLPAWGSQRVGDEDERERRISLYTLNHIEAYNSESGLSEAVRRKTNLW